MTISVKLKWLNNGKGLNLPMYQTVGAACMDVCAAIDEGECLILSPKETVVIPLGFAVAIPEGYEIQVRSRSGLAAKSGIHVLNAPGTVDCDYRGEMKVILHNTSDEPFYIVRGDRIAQMLVSPVYRMSLHEVEDLDDTARGSGGFGSTGV